MNEGLKNRAGRLATEHGTLLALILLCVAFSIMTINFQKPAGKGAGSAIGETVAAEFEPGSRVVLIAAPGTEGADFIAAAESLLVDAEIVVVAKSTKSPGAARETLEKIAASNEGLDAIICDGTAGIDYTFLPHLNNEIPAFTNTPVVEPEVSYYPNFLKIGNLVNLLNQTTIYAIIAIGMTLVIITGGIDLSVGSLVALGGVTCAALIRDLGGGGDATFFSLALCSIAAIFVCGVAGLFTGSMITIFNLPPFIITLGMMQAMKGLAYKIAGGSTIFDPPESFTQFASGKVIPGIPNAIVIAAILFVVAHVVMTRTVLGRYIYAAGGNPEAARLSGVPVKRVLLVAYTACGLLAGLIGVIHCSQFASASGNLGEMYELHVIAAVVVGGTSLFGGEGKIVGTFIGALLLAVIANGMNLIGLKDYDQRVVLGAVIIGAAVLDSRRKKI